MTQYYKCKTCNKLCKEVDSPASLIDWAFVECPKCDSVMEINDWQEVEVINVYTGGIR